jgi:hypothetical protein
VIAAFAFSCLFGVCQAPESASLPRRHSLTVATAFDSTAEYDAAFGSHNWNVPARYIDLFVAPPGEYDRRIRAAGAQTALYVDANFCSGTSAPGRNPYARPDCGSWPVTAFYSQDGHPERVLSSRSGPVLQRIGNPASSVWRERTIATIEEVLKTSAFDLVQLDDAVTPDEYYAPLCWGTPGFEAGMEACEGSAGGRAASPWSRGFSRDAWRDGERSLIQALPIPAIVNGLAGNDRKGLPVAAGLSIAASNAWGAMCDGCFYGNGAIPKNVFLWTGPVFESRLQGALEVTAAGKNVVVVDEDVTDTAARRRALADIMLFYDADRTWTWGGPCGPHSRIHACPESALTFYEPYDAYPKTVADLAAPGGSYEREFGACYESGRPIGPCAAVINPAPGVVHRLPRLRNVYTHTLEISGDSLCACYGDHGALSLTGPPPPDPLPPASGYVLFR